MTPNPTVANPHDEIDRLDAALATVTAQDMREDS